jgi:phosphocarrier protein
MVEKKVKVTNPTGLNARPAALFVQTAGKFASKIWISKGIKQVNAKSIMGLMSLAISQNSEVTIGADGEDENVAVKELMELVLSGFRE